MATATATRTLPVGVVTFLFTDIEGSTKHLQRLGDRYDAVLATHHDVIRQSITQHRGVEVDTAGDGFFVAFASATDAVAAAAAAQRALAGDPLLATEGIKVRMGLHSGEVRLTGDNYVGLAVHHAARVSNAGHGGQVLVSEATRGFVQELPGVGFVDLGTHELKDLVHPIRLYQLSIDGLEAAFPGVRALGASGDNLPRPRTSFVGRERDIELLRDRLSAPGLVTLTGPGGSGKTRLAVEASRIVVREHSLRGWFVDLRETNDLQEVEMAVVTALDVAGTAGGEAGDPLARAIARLRSEAALVVLDNCEPVVDAAAQVAERLLDGCPEVRLLVTSRELLGVAGELAQRVSPLDVSPADSGDPLASPAARLFCDRAATVDPAFSPDPPEAVERICRRLDGIPLAIELAAARSRHMSLPALESGLADMFRLLVGSERRAVKRPQTLEAVIDWSYRLLTEEEASLLRRLAVFAGGFTIEAASAVCGGDGEDVSHVVFRLIDGSLVEREHGDRYRLLETVREFGLARLRDAGDGDEVRRRHFDYFHARAIALGTRARRGEFFEALAEFEPDVANLRAAFAFGVDHGLVEAAVEAVAQSSWILCGIGSSADVRAALTVLEAHEDALQPRRRAELLAGLSSGGLWSGEHLEAAVRAVELFDQLDEGGEHEFLAWALCTIGVVSGVQGGDAETVRSALTRVLELDAGPLTSGFARGGAAWIQVLEGDLPAGRSTLAEVLDDARREGLDALTGPLLFWSGLMSMHARDWAAAKRFYEEAIPIFRRLSYKLWVQWMLDHVAKAVLSLGDLAGARAYAEEGLSLSRESGLAGRGNYFSLLATVALIEEAEGNLEQAAAYERERLDLVREMETPREVVLALTELASLHRRMGDEQAAASLLTESLGLLQDLQPEWFRSGTFAPPPVARVLDVTAGLLLARGHSNEAAQLLSAADQRRASTEGNPDGLMARRAEAIRDQARAALSSEELDHAFGQGAALEDPVASALAFLAGDRSLQSG